jgi:Domain of unknown function (DUF4173)
MRSLLCAVAAGVAAATLVPLDRPGLGWLLGGLAAFAAVLASGRRRAWSPARVGAAAAVVLLLAAGTLRDAHWLFALCVAVALPFASLAVAGGGGTWGRLLRGAVALAVSVPAAARTTGSAVATGRGGRARQVATGTAAGLVLASVFAGLFAAANPAFRVLLRDLTPRLTVGRVVVLLAVGGLTLAAAYLRTRPPVLAAPDPEPGAHRRMLARAEWAVPLALVDLVFVAFVWAEGVVLFGGYRYVLAPGGPTFAGYARSGFWELGLVTLLSLGIVAVIAYRVDRTDAVLVRVLGGTLCVLTLVVVASALFRMSTYVDAYGYTRSRLLGTVAVSVLGALVVLLLVAGVRLRGRWLPGAAATVVVLAVLGLVAVNPGAVVARTVIGRYQHDGHLDGGVLTGLSDDAVPELDALPEPWRSCVLNEYYLRVSTMDTWRELNLGRFSARAAWDRHHPVPVPVVCDGVVETRR